MVLIIGLGIAVRVAGFPHTPPGFNQDEASAAYEAYALSETGKDRWGNVWPPYFPGWGSGQNVLLSYLTIPFIKAFGLSVFSARLPMLLLGILTLPLFAFALRPLGRYVTLLGLLALAVAPWHVMLSRWALESNSVPFFMLAGGAMVSRGLITGKRRWIVPSLLPFAAALYAYGTTAAVLPVMAVIVLFTCFRQLRARTGAWLLAGVLFLLAAAPFILFFTENYLLKTNLSWTDSLPFSTPLLPSNRMEQVSSEPHSAIFRSNLAFLTTGFNDDTVYNLVPGIRLLFLGMVPLGIISIVAAGWQVLRRGAAKAASPERTTLAVFLAWAVGAALLALFFELNVNRFNHFYLPLLLLAAWAIGAAVRRIPHLRYRRLAGAAVLAAVAIQGGIFLKTYFGEYQKGSIRAHFNDGLGEAFAAVSMLPEGPVYIGDWMQLNYVYTAFYTRYPPARFQREVQYHVNGEAYQVTRLGSYVFDRGLLEPGRAHGYLMRKAEAAEKDKANTRKIRYSNWDWEVGTMQ